MLSKRLIPSAAIGVAIVVGAALSLPVSAHHTAETATIQRLKNQRMFDTTAADGFRYFSGHAGSLHNLPAIYAGGSGRSARLVVVGNGVERAFPLSERAAAFRAYEDLLRRSGYLTE